MMKKMPGVIPSLPKIEVKRKVENLNSKTKVELQEILDRQQKIINNKHFLKKLPDNGAKIIEFWGKVKRELELRTETENTCNLLARLKLEDSKNKLIDVEWNGENTNNSNYIDSDDDSDPEDIFQIITNNAIGPPKIKLIDNNKSLITDDDLREIGTFDNDSSIPDHIKFILNINDKEKKQHVNFKPFKTTKSDVHNPSKEILRKKGKFWEVTAASPPPIKHEPMKPVSLMESLKLQKSYNEHLKEIELNLAAKKLASHEAITIGIDPFGIIGSYEIRGAQDEGSDCEVSDVESEKGGVTFPIMD